jgi:ribosomal protein L35AE/L33A
MNEPKLELGTRVMYHQRELGSALQGRSGRTVEEPDEFGGVLVRFDNLLTHCLVCHLRVIRERAT